MAGGKVPRRFLDEITDLSPEMQGRLLRVLRERAVRPILERIAGPRARDIELSVAAMQALVHYSWPGDVRELQTALERAVALAEAAPVELHHLPVEIQRSVPEVLHRPEPSNQLSGRSQGAPFVPEDALEDRDWAGSPPRSRGRRGPAAPCQGAPEAAAVHSRRVCRADVMTAARAGSAPFGRRRGVGKAH